MSAIGLVLAGGGGKGAYQIGVWEVLEEYGIVPNIKAISGTSVGALNAVLFAQGDLELAREVWSTISPKAVMKMNVSLLHQRFVRSILRSTSLIPAGMAMPYLGSASLISAGMANAFERQIYQWLTKQADQGLLSKKGLSRLIDNSIEFQRVRSFDGPIYVAAYNISSRKLEYFNLKDNDSLEAIKARLLASASIPVIFGKTRVDKDLYWDGGTPVLGDNVPVKPLYDDGIRDLIVVHLDPEDPVDRNRFPGCNIIEIMPQEDLGGLISGTMNFRSEVAKDNIKRGHDDAKRKLESVDLTAFIHPSP